MATSVGESVNHWPDTKCAKAFWSQRNLQPYRQLFTDTCAWLDPQPGERWLDLGAGSGQLTRALWEKSQGTLQQVTALDCAGANAKSIEKLRTMVQPPPGDHLRFAHADFSAGLTGWGDASVNGVVSGLAIQYAEHYCPERGCWTTDAYERLLGEVNRVLRPGGWFVFSVNVPEPSWAKIALYAIPGLIYAPRLVKCLKNCVRMWRYGLWLKREARRGRFHYLPIEDVTAKLKKVGFGTIEHRLSFAGQAYVVRAQKPLAEGQSLKDRRAA